MTNPFSADFVDETPVSLYRALAGYIVAGDYEAAVVCYALAGVYGRFDSYRVADPSSHQIVGFLKDAAFADLPAPRKAEFQKFAGEVYNNAERRQLLCERVKSIGKPAYSPTYMLSHGLGAMIDVQQEGASSPALVKPFDADAAWLNAMSTYLGCQ
jgi:hypothetical protein